MDQDDYPDEEHLDDHALPAKSRGRYYAEQLFRKYGVTPPLTYSQVEEICRAEGMEIFLVPTSRHDGYYDRRPFPHAVLKRACAWTAGHELGHHLATEDFEHDVRLYASWWSQTPEERVCNDLADALTRDPKEPDFYPPHRSDWDDSDTDEWFDESGV